MNKFLIISFLLAALARSPAQELSLATTPAGAACPICAASRTYREADRVKDGLSVDLLIGPAQINQPVTILFFVSEKPRNWPEDNLELEHEKFIHVIGVRDDLQEFFHIHPVKTGPGLWSVTHTFTHGGSYKIWSDVRCGGVSYTFAHPLLQVTGNAGISTANRDRQDRVTAAGYRISLKHSEPFTIAKTNQLQFTIRDASGNEIETENFLGAAMHLVMIKDDLSAYIHAHPDNAGAMDSKFHFSPVFVSAGTYKLFAQFRPAKSKLPADEAIVAEFYVDVATHEGIASR